MEGAETMRLITITGIEHYFGQEIFRPGQTLILKKDLDNSYDSEAIQAELETGVKVGYVANSIHTVARGSHSAGRIYEIINDRQPVKILCILYNCVIAELDL